MVGEELVARLNKINREPTNRLAEGTVLDGTVESRALLPFELKVKNTKLLRTGM